jgi:murein DD-endopeptidase MepM/ murein hydrolase activator NlpD
MKSGARQMAGGEQILVRSRDRRKRFLLLIAALLTCGLATAQTLYKYRGADGEWIYSDRPPDDGRDVQSLQAESSISKPGLSVAHAFTGDGLEFIARNTFYAPVEVALEFDDITGVDYPHPDDDRIWVVPARSELLLFELPALEDLDAPSVNYRYVYLPGDPSLRPDEDVTYRVPYAVGTAHRVSQTYPVSDTHRTRDSMYAVDFAMPIGTDIVAARDGVVFDVASTNFKGGPDEESYADLANLVRILHDDGTYAVYAHLNWNTIRVRPGDRVAAGEYIADSGNTGFTSGPHLHFAVQRNLGMRVESLPVAFRGPDGNPVQPETGVLLTAYP